MKLYAVENANTMSSVGYYWANNSNEAINEHRRQTGTDAKLMASAVWANNRDATCRGYVVSKED